MQILLNGRYRTQMNPQDLAKETASLQRAMMPLSPPRPFQYPKSPYALSGLGNNCLPYDFYALQAAFGVTDCTVAPYTSDPATQYACVQKNAPLLQQIALLSPSYGTCITQSMIPGPYTPSVPIPATPMDPFTGPGLLYNPQAPTQTPSPMNNGNGPIYSPTVTWSPSRVGPLQPGDTWTIQITGAQPNSPVSVYGGVNGSFTTNSMGTTKGDGTFLLSGVIDSSQYGSWQETWTAGGINAGNFSFTVAPAPSQSPTGQSPTGGSQSPTGTSNSPGAGTSSTNPPAVTTGDWIPGVSNTVVMIGGGAALVALTLLGGRR
jgi:hypothetical protein